jgi:hypothetical protein
MVQVMESIYVFLIRNDVWIYILCGLGLLWYSAELIRSRGLLKRAMFGLEKERGRRMMSRSLLLIVLFVLVIAAVTYVNLSIGPTLPADLLKPPTPTPNVFATPLSSPTPAGGPATPTLVLAPTVTLPASGPADGNGAPIDPGVPAPVVSPPAEDVTATSPPEGPAAICIPNVTISAPPDGATISGSVTFFGTATDDDFGYFDLAATGPQTSGAWESLVVNNADAPVFDNIIAGVNVTTWIPGPYRFRLSVFDSADSLAGQCEIQLSVASSG